jgi:WD40 repeat protein
MIATWGDFEVQVCAAGHCKTVLPLPTEANGIGTVAFAPGGRLLLVGDGNGRVHFVDVSRDPRAPVAAKAHDYFVEHLAFDKDGNMAASGGRDGTVVLWDLAERRPLGQIAPRPTPLAQFPR